MWTTDNIGDQLGKTVIITGGNTGIGFETAKALYEKGANVILGCRDLAKAELAAREIILRGGKGKIEISYLNLSSLSSVMEFAEGLISRAIEIDLLINNAGIMTPPQSFSAEGYELQFGVNFLGHFALTGKLYSMISRKKDSRIITVTSLAYTHGRINFDNLKSEQSYEPYREYAQSKLAGLLFTLELQRKISQYGGHFLSLAAHPGITNTEIARYMTAEQVLDAEKIYGPFMEAQQGTLSILYAATSPNVRNGGLYGPGDDGGLRGFPTDSAIMEQALDSGTATRLWKMAEHATGVIFPKE